MANMTEEKISGYSVIIDSMNDEEMSDPSNNWKVSKRKDC